MLCCLFASAAAQAQNDPRSIEPRLERVHFVTLCQGLGLSREQQQMVELLFADYQRDMTALGKELDEATAAAGRKTIEEAVAGKARVSQDELKRMRIAVLRAVEKTWQPADDALETFLGSMEVVLIPSQIEGFDHAVRRIHRDLFLSPRRTDSQSPEYAGDGVDLLELIAAAAEPGNELSGLNASQLAPISNDYEVRLDQLIRTIASNDRQARHERKIAAIERDAAAVRSAEQAYLATWHQLYSLNSSFAMAIGGFAESALSEEARTQWMQRYQRATFPWLFPRKRPDRQIDWLREQNLPSEKMQAAESAYAQFVDQRHALAQQAIDIMLRARTEFQVMLHPMADQASIADRLPRSVFDDLLKITGSQTSLENSTSAAFEAVLDERQRQSMREAMNRPDVPRRR